MHLTSPLVHRTLKLVALLSVLALCAGDVGALGLGELSVRSRLGAALKAEVQVIESVGDTRFSGECFHLSSSGEADTGLPTLIRGRISLERQNGQSKLIIASDQIINDPVLQINLRASCGSEVVRSYTVLIDPASPQQLVGQIGSSLPPANQSLGPVKPTQSLASVKSNAKVWQTAQGDSAQSISRALFPRQPSAQRRFLTALRAENPQLDLGVNGETLLDAETALNIPAIRRQVPSLPAVDVGEAPAPKEANPKIVPRRLHREKSPVQKPAGRISDRLVLSGNVEDASPESELPLRMSTDLSVRGSSRVSENSRALLRLEYKVLSALYAQAEQQLAMAEKVRNLETSFEEIRAANESTVRQTEVAMAAATSAKPPGPAETSAAGSPPSTPVTASPPRASSAVKVETGGLKQERSSTWWLEILIILGLGGALSWALSRRPGKRTALPLPLAEEKSLRIPMPFNKLFDVQDLWVAKDKSAALQQAESSDSALDIALDETPASTPVASLVIDKEVKQGLPVKEVTDGETEDFSRVIELADIMVLFGRIKGATQALEEFLAREPETALAPWLKLLEIYRMNDMRNEFEAYSAKLRTHFNVAPASWEVAGECLAEPIAPVDEKELSIEELLQKLPTIGTLPHIKENIQTTWGSPDGLAYLKHLLRDTRDGTRGGFPLAYALELQFLVDLLDARSQITA